jgi:hypothetical protein
MLVTITVKVSNKTLRDKKSLESPLTFCFPKLDSLRAAVVNIPLLACRIYGIYASSLPLGPVL